jgi:hypothetical protein
MSKIILPDLTDNEQNKCICYFLWTLHEREPFCPPKREITPVKYIFLESKSEMCKWSIDTN